MPRRFPFPINVGTDICSVQRIFNIIAQKNGPYAIQFMTRILTPVEREADGASVQKHMNKWWNLQDKRRKRGLERKQYLWDAFDSHRSLRQFHGPSTGLEERGATDLELAREGSTNSLEDAARADYVADEAAHCEPSGKQAIRAPEPVDSEKPEGRAMAEATADGGAKVLGEQAEHEEVEVEADEVAAISPDEKATASGERRTHEGQDPPLEEIDKELDSTYPYMRNLAQFLAGRFAAKEAVIKAYQSRRLTYHDIMVLRTSAKDGMSQAPTTMVISEDGDWDDAQIIPMSISHDGGFATAMCLAHERSQAQFSRTQKTL